MPRRSYHQHCSLALALDLVGERWTLLLVRDLLCGPQRYGELLKGLPGIGTNLLATRLKSLLAEGLIEKVEEDGREVYRLTALGLQLEPAVVALAKFGAGRLGNPREGDLWRALWTPIAMKANFRADRARGVDQTYEFCIDQDRFWVQVSGEAIETGTGPAQQPAFRLECDGETFLQFANGAHGPQEFTELPGVLFEGDLAALVQCTRLFAPGE